MRRGLKRKISIGVSVFLMILFAVIALPQMTADVQAETLRTTWYDLSTETSMTVEAGSKFYIGDFVMVLGQKTSATASMRKATYKSSDTKLVTVSQKGYVNAKKESIVDITVACQGKTLVCHLTVDSKNAFGNSKQEKQLRAAIKTLTKGMPSEKLTSGKAFNFITKYRKFLNNYYKNSVTKLSYDGFLYNNERPAADGVDEFRSEMLAVPEAGRFWTAYALIRQFQLNNDPTSTKSGNAMKVTSVAASSKSGKITAQLNKAITQDQILAAQLTFSDYNVAAGSKKKADITVSIYDQTARTFYKGKVTLKKGSKQLTIQPVIYRGLKYHNVSLIKGHVYMVGSSMNWAGGKKATAK